MRILLFDTETGGLTTKHTLLTAFFFMLDDNLEILGELELNLKPNNGVYNVTEKALEVNGLDLKEHDKIAITYKEGCEKLEYFINKHRDYSRIICSGHNVTFDIRFLKRCLMRKSFWDANFNSRIIDTCDLALSLRICNIIPIKHSLRLEPLSKLFKCQDREAHIAREDVLMTRDLLLSIFNLFKSIPLTS